MNGPVVTILALFCALAAGKTITPFKSSPQRIIGGTETTIDHYPYAAAMLYNRGGIIFRQSCGGTILTSDTILSVAHCYIDFQNGQTDLGIWWRIRVGSTSSISGGQVHNILRIRVHPLYSRYRRDNDIAVLFTQTRMEFGPSVAPGSIAGANYGLPDNSPVWAIGWGSTTTYGPVVYDLRHVQLFTINSDICNERHSGAIAPTMLCAGWLDLGGADQCQGDSGGPLIHNNVIVGITSWGVGCGTPYYPGVNTRVSSYSNWIVETVESG